MATRPCLPGLIATFHRHPSEASHFEPVIDPILRRLPIGLTPTTRMDFFPKERQSALQAKEYAQFLAFAPAAFQATRALVRLGILEAIAKSGSEGSTCAEVAEATGLSDYGARVLLEAGLGAGILKAGNGRFVLTKVGHFLLHDEMTRVNFDFMNDVCYRGFFDLEESVRTGRPEGLKTLGEWSTIYEALAHLPEPIRESWLRFDHYYSDAAFVDALPRVFRNGPRRLLDIGGNTGRWAARCVEYSAHVQVCIADLADQLDMAAEALHEHPGADRITFCPVDVLDPEAVLPGGWDALWMSQFLDCFSEAQIHAILAKCRRVMTPESRVYILEPLWDRQRFSAAAFSLQFTSLYFTALANGNSQMYHSDLLLSLVRESGFEIEAQFDNLGISHTLLVCRPALG